MTPALFRSVWDLMRSKQPSAPPAPAQDPWLDTRLPAASAPNPHAVTTPAPALAANPTLHRQREAHADALAAALTATMAFQETRLPPEQAAPPG